MVQNKIVAGGLMNKLFKYFKFVFILFISIAILNDILSYLYIALVWKDPSGWVSQLSEILAFLLAGYLAYKSNFISNILICFLTLQSLNTIYQATPHLYSLDWLTTGPQILFRNILMTALLAICVIHFILLLALRFQKRSLNN